VEVVFRMTASAVKLVGVMVALMTPSALNESDCVPKTTASAEKESDSVALITAEAENEPDCVLAMTAEAVMANG